jgi:hypothetical protein
MKNFDHLPLPSERFELDDLLHPAQAFEHPRHVPAEGGESKAAQDQGGMRTNGWRNVMQAKTGPTRSTHDTPHAVELATLRRLWRGLERTKEAVARSMIAYRESRELLRRIDESGVRDCGGSS